MASGNMPAAEHPIDELLVKGLLEDQHPDLAGLPLRELACGWDNVIYRLGPAHLVRLPRREIAAGLVANEQRWLPLLGPRLPLPIPVPRRVGAPGRGYPWSWSICAWIPGETAAEAQLDMEGAARDLAAFLVALHTEAPPEARRNEFRGGALSSRNQALEERLAFLGDEVDGGRVRTLWEEAVAIERDPSERLWIHGDLHPANLVVRNRRLAAVLDFGDLTGGDRATDLSVAWMLFDADTRPIFRAAVSDVDEATWGRARGWALSHALACLANSDDNPRMNRVGATTLRNVVEDRSGG